VIQEVWDLLEADSSSSLANSSADDVSDQCRLAISEVAILGISTPRTLKIKGSIQHLEILVLIDSGSSHSFISEQVASELQGLSYAVKQTGFRKY
jgi:hypothetical protein